MPVWRWCGSFARWSSNVVRRHDSHDGLDGQDGHDCHDGFDRHDGRDGHDRGSTLLVEMSIPTGGGLLPRVRRVQLGCADIHPTSLDVPFKDSARLPRHSPRCSGRAHRQTYQLARPSLWSSMMGLMVVASRSKSRQKSAWEIRKGQRFGGT